MCYKEWFLGSSDNSRCQNFVENNIYTTDFQCTYCCTKDDCNAPLRPSPDSLYTDTSTTHTIATHSTTTSPPVTSKFALHFFLYFNSIAVMDVVDICSCEFKIFLIHD